jgi:ligand-binding SRPBCC domain-containing protein
MSIHWESGTDVNRPIDEVWAFLTDWYNTPRLSGSGTIGLRQTSLGPMGVGSTLQGRRVILGFETRNTYECTEWDPPRAVTTTMEGKPFRSFVSRVTLEPTAEGTRAIAKVDFELLWWMQPLYPFVGPMLKRRWKASFARIKAVLEAMPDGSPN